MGEEWRQENYYWLNLQNTHQIFIQQGIVVGKQIIVI